MVGCVRVGGFDWLYRMERGRDLGSRGRDLGSLLYK